MAPPDHRQPCPWVGDPIRAGTCLQSGKDSSPVNSATPLAEDGDPVLRPRSESQCRPDCGDCARLVAMARLPDCCWFHSSPVFLSSTFILQGAAYPTAVVARLPDSGGMTSPHLAAVCAQPGPLGSPRGQSPWGCCPTQIIFRLLDCAYCPTARLGFAVQTPDCMYPTATQLYSSGQHIYIYIYIYIYMYIYIYTYIFIYIYVYTHMPSFYNCKAEF